MRYFSARIFCLILIAIASNFLFVTVALADPSTPDGIPDFDPDNVPIDGGASLLIAAGVAYGLKKIHDKRKSKSNSELS